MFIYCGIIFILEGQYSWVAKIFIVNGDITSLLVASSGYFDKN